MMKELYVSGQNSLMDGGATWSPWRAHVWSRPVDDPKGIATYQLCRSHSLRFTSVAGFLTYARCGTVRRSLWCSTKTFPFCRKRPEGSSSRAFCNFPPGRSDRSHVALSLMFLAMASRCGKTQLLNILLVAQASYLPAVTVEGPSGFVETIGSWHLLV